SQPMPFVSPCVMPILSFCSDMDTSISIYKDTYYSESAIGRMQLKCFFALRRSVMFCGWTIFSYLCFMQPVRADDIFGLKRIGFFLTVENWTLSRNVRNKG
ncbi:hypothetical protein, partial [Alistipes finegoldii]|uniref:hypothetical protein n=1 Tax=Alistipes finegoldii TaxID=214856 RepID=UPI003AAAF07A